jgi:lysozyme
MADSNRIKIAALALSAVALVGLVGYEGYTDRAIIPIPGDVPTIGFGTTEGVHMGDRTTPPVALGRALRDVQKFEGAIKRCVTVALYQHEYDSFTQLAYNIGSGAFCGSTLVRKLNAGDYAGACAEISRWDRAGGRVVRGLTIRRAAERAQCEQQPPGASSGYTVGVS